MTYEHSDNYLIHHGVKGQKRGFRRYQNEDGSLTAEGREHYGVGEGNKKAGGNVKVESKNNNSNATDEKRARRRNILKKVAIGAGAAALLGASAYAVKKSTNLRDELRKQAKEQANDAMWAKHLAASKARTFVDNSKMARHDERMGRNETWINRTVSANNQRYSHEHFQLAKRAADLEKKYTDISKNATRRDAVKNYFQNYGRISVDNAYRESDRAKTQRAIRERLENDRRRASERRAR